MQAESHFASDYADARARFLEAAAAAGAALESHGCPAPGPAGEALHCDTAWIGPPEARAVLVTLSATHGAEGYCGSGVQVGWLAEGLHRELPADTALLHIHAINPHGFAWTRRVTEDNVDLNRNFVDHAGPLPENPGYEELAEVLCPRDWSDATIAETQTVLDAYVQAHGARGLQQAVSGGQYRHPDGIFYGGAAETWSAGLLRRIFAARLGRARDVAVIDYHTGLGPRGYGERICVHEPESDGLARARAWYDDDVTSPALGDSASIEICGFNTAGMEESIPDARLTAVALEYGTLPSPEVRLALRADNWLHQHGEPGSAKGKTIKRQIREAFYQDSADWKRMVWERALETQRKALRGLAGA